MAVAEVVLSNTMGHAAGPAGGGVPDGVAVAVPVGVPVAAPVGVPVAVPVAVAVAVAVAVPVGVAVGVPVGVVDGDAAGVVPGEVAGADDGLVVAAADGVGVTDGVRAGPMAGATPSSKVRSLPPAVTTSAISMPFTSSGMSIVAWFEVRDRSVAPIQRTARIYGRGKLALPRCFTVARIETHSVGRFGLWCAMQGSSGIRAATSSKGGW
jgi:hypothetical protein